METLYPYDPRDSLSCPITPQTSRFSRRSIHSPHTAGLNGSESRHSIHSSRAGGLNGLRRKEFSLSPFTRPSAPAPDEKILTLNDLQEHTGVIITNFNDSYFTKALSFIIY